MLSNDEWTTRREVAATFKVSLRTVGRWLEDGLPHAKFGKAANAAVRIRRSDLEAWVEQHAKS